MAQVLEAGLAEVLREHEEKIPAAQAWCVQQNIRSLDELKSQGENAIDEFVKAAGAIKVLKTKTSAFFNSGARTRRTMAASTVIGAPGGTWPRITSLSIACGAPPSTSCAGIPVWIPGSFIHTCHWTTRSTSPRLRRL